MTLLAHQTKDIVWIAVIARVTNVSASKAK